MIGREELVFCYQKCGIQPPVAEPEIPYNVSLLSDKADDYLLILGTSLMQSGQLLTLLSLRDQLGINPDKSEPCFYNQDWYLNEKFMNKPLENKWYLIKKNIFDNSRAQNADELTKDYIFPSAIVCAYAFFVNYFSNGDYLWQHDFVWCDDLDHNGDRIYVGKYFDVAGANKNGFSIHRHLRIRENYGAVELL